MKRFADSAARFASGLFMWLFAIAGLLMLPQIVFWPGVLLFAAYVLFNVRRGERGKNAPEELARVSQSDLEGIL